MGLVKRFTASDLPRARNNERMRPINLIVIHCSASPNADSLFRGKAGAANFQNPAQVIDDWHFAPPKSFRRPAAWRAKQNPSLRSIGYHYVIGRDGTVFTGRHVDEIPAQVTGFNQKAIGICLIGIDQFSPAQWSSLAHVVTAEVARITGRNGPTDRNNPLTPAGAIRLAGERGLVICGHRDLSPDQNKNGIVEPFEWLKTCPGFDVSTWLGNNMTPEAPQ